MKKLVIGFIILISICVVSAFAQNPPVKCTAITKAGTQCTRNAIAGKTYCRQHDPAFIKADTSKIYTGKKGGKYKIKNGKKIYVK